MNCSLFIICSDASHFLPPTLSLAFAVFFCCFSFNFIYITDTCKQMWVHISACLYLYTDTYVGCACAHICRVVYCQLFVAFILQLLFLFLTFVFVVMVILFIYLISFYCLTFFTHISHFELHCSRIFEFFTPTRKCPESCINIYCDAHRRMLHKEIIKYTIRIYCIYKIFEISQITVIPQAYAENFKDCNKIQNVSIACHIELSQDTQEYKQNWNSLQVNKFDHSAVFLIKQYS